MTSLIVSTDGYCAPTPTGLATWGFVVQRGNARVHEASGVADREGTSELAEWRGAYEALDWLLANAPAGTRVAFRNDSARVVRALAGEAPVPTGGETRRLAQECRRLWKELHERDVLVAFSRIPRWENADADRLASEAHAREVRGGDEYAPTAEGEEEFDLPPSRRGNR